MTGESANLKNLEKYFQDFLGLNTILRRKDNLGKDFSASFGGIRIITEGWETEAIPETKARNIEKVGFLRKIFRGF